MLLRLLVMYLSGTLAGGVIGEQCVARKARTYRLVVNSGRTHLLTC